MPSSGPRTDVNRLLRDYLVAALRCSERPQTTTQLRRKAPAVAVWGSPRPLPPAQETIYRLLRSLQGEGTITATKTDTGHRAWLATPDPAVDHEIASLEALFGSPSASGTYRRSEFDPCRRRR